MSVQQFQCPVGTLKERSAGKVWPGEWMDATGYGTLYTINGARAYHTGADLNLNAPVHDSDAHGQVYSIAAGEVTTARWLPVWGNIVIIRHPFSRTLSSVGVPKPVYARYAHLENIEVVEGQSVETGQVIGNIGNAGGRYAYHLHFDISHTSVLYTNPAHWPRLNVANLQANYLDPRAFLEKFVQPFALLSSPTVVIRTTENVNIRAGAGLKYAVIGMLKKGTEVPIYIVRRDGFWELAEPVQGKTGYIAAQFTEQV